ncbi:hypothetical protein BDQ17DRAFT_1344231 [Cyathus striatus]|nr:hypothetical protein BDQ17DRAFT_1344231 [Cyathus striatus]
MSEVIMGIRHWYPGAHPPRSRSTRSIRGLDYTSDLSIPPINNFETWGNSFKSPSAHSAYPADDYEYEPRSEIVVTPEPVDPYERVDPFWQVDAAGRQKYVGFKGARIREVDDDEELDDENNQALLRTYLESVHSDDFRETSPVDPKHVPPTPRMIRNYLSPKAIANPHFAQILPGHDDDSSELEDYGNEVSHSRLRDEFRMYIDWPSSNVSSIASRPLGLGEYAIPGDGISMNADQSDHIQLEQPPLKVSSNSAQNPLCPPLPNHARMPLSPSNAIHAPQSFKPVMDETPETSLVSANLGLLQQLIPGVEGMFWGFTQTTDSEAGSLADHVQMCRRIATALTRWNSRSTRWHDKYTQRLRSLDRTLQRLMGIKRLVESRTRVPRPDQLKKVLEKLAQHERKLADLEVKFNAAFDRLKTKHLHAMLSAAHANAVQLKNDHANERDVFKRKWSQGKNLRAHLRQQFFKYSRS